ncbi:C40 family peptidase [Actinomycetospora sp.]|jgi:cell wall-associated NlpC family hydrolase|uniref:C40 family peptidase n=1 Tax=Actinomycetospora sp. TaxID=1872135 RepID=UPI002F412AAF
MTAVLPPSARPLSAGRHRAPDAATTGSLGPIPQEWAGRAAHGSPLGEAAAPRPQRESRPGPAPLNRAARTAGLSLAALGALAGAGGAAAHGLLPSDEPASTGDIALPANLAASNLSLQGTSHQVQAPAVTTVMPVVPAASSVQAPQYKTVAAAQRQAAPAAKPAAKPAADQPSSTAAEAIEAAESKLGKPYVWGATGPNSFDCSGLMQFAFEKAGADLPRTSAAQSKVGDKVSMDDLKPGDLIFLYSPVSHVVMYVGNGKVIEAPNSGEDVRYTPLSKIQKNAVGARRVA